MKVSDQLIARKSINEALTVGRDLLGHAGRIAEAADKIVRALKAGGQAVLFGNGGSAADAQHIATELVCRFEKNRRSCRAVALTTNSSLLTAVSNDYGFSRVFSRQAESCVQHADVVIAISTSGNSQNVILGARQARKQGAYVIGMTGAVGGKLQKECHLCLTVPSRRVARIQEMHILIGHILCELVEKGIK